MTQFREQHQPCPCGKSSDAYAVYQSGVGICFSCGDRFAPDGEVTSGGTMADKKVALIPDVEPTPLNKRGLSQETCAKYGYGVGVFNSEKVQVAPYHNAKGRVVAQKIRFASKDFLVLGDMSKATLFGQQSWRAGGKRITITEGELDALSVVQAMGTWPVVSVPNGAAGAYAALQKQIEFLEGYDLVVLAFDNDAEGHAATEKCVELFSPGKVAVVNMGTYKDANEVLVEAGPKDLRTMLWEAQVWRPDGVVNLADVKARIQAPMLMGTPYPWAGLNEKLFGFRPQEVVTWTAGTGTGKTALVSELVYSLIQQDIRTGIIYLEEGIDRAGRRIVGLHMNKAIHLPDVEYTDEEFEEAWAATLGKGVLFAYDHFGSLDEETLINRIRYMVKGLECKVIVLDHISMVVSGASLDGDERRLLDHIMTSLRSLTQETGATIHVVSHLRRPPGGGSHEEGRQVSLSHLRGTQAIAQLSDAVIAAERDQQAEDETERNTTVLRVLKNRYAGLTGEAASLLYNHATGRLLDVWDQATADAADDF